MSLSLVTASAVAVKVTHENNSTSKHDEVHQRLVIFVIIEAVTLLLLVGYLLRRFAVPSTPWWVKLPVYVGWVLGSSMVLLLPLDVALTDSDIEYDKNLVIQIWKADFWAASVMAYACFPLLKGVAASGAFTFCGKVRQSIYGSLLFYVVAIVIGIAALVWVWFSGLTTDAFLGFVMSLANIYALLLITLLLSYGLVDIPRHLWMLGDYQRYLRSLQLQVRYLLLVTVNDVYSQVPTIYYFLVCMRDAGRVYGVSRIRSGYWVEKCLQRS